MAGPCQTSQVAVLLIVYKILMEEDYKPVAQPKRRLNPTTKEVFKKEVVKLLEARMIHGFDDAKE